MLSRKQKRDLALAFHEAGHAVLSLYFGCAVDFVSIVSRARYGGITRGKTSALNADPSYASRFSVDKEVMILQAGVLAQRRHNPKSWRRWHGEDDINKAYAIISSHEGGVFDDWASRYQAVELKTQELLAQPRMWNQITAVAYALLDRNTLNSEEIGEIVSN